MTQFKTLSELFRSSLRSKETVAVLAVCALLLLAGPMILTDLSLYTPDSARYLVWANSLAKLDGFIDRTLPEPERYVVHAPVYSLLLAPVQAVIPGSIVAAKWVTLAFGALAVVLMYFWSARLIGRGPALAAAILLALNPLFLQYATEVLSDVPFLVCLLLFFMISDVRRDAVEVSTSKLVAFGVCISAGVLLREIGLTLLLAVVSYLLLEKQYRAALIVFLLCAVPLGLWKLRNDVIVAGLEHPALVNTRLMFSHSFTLPSESLVAEFWARATSNAAVYLKTLPGAVLYPVYIRSYSNLVSFREPLIYAVADAMQVIKYFLGTLSVALALAGAWRDLRSSPGGKARCLFLAFYIGVVLVYPFNDQRFLLPVMLLMIYYIVHASAGLWARWRSGARWKPGAGWVLGAVALALLVPNLVWDGLYFANCRAYNRAPVQFAEEIVKRDDYPWHFSRPFASVGDWLVKNSGPDDVIIAQWKDLAMWAQPRRVIPANQNILPMHLTALFRDYHVRYIVSAQGKNGIMEYQVPMLLQERYTFVPRVSFANLTVYEVAPRDRRGPDQPADSSMLAAAYHMLRHRRYGSADSLLQGILRRYPESMNAIFCGAVVKEFKMELAAAESVFALFGSFGQSGMYLEEANAHRQIIALLRRSGPGATPPAERASSLVMAAAAYGELGYRAQARDLLADALKADSTFTPAIIFTITFALQDADTAAARRGLEELRRRDPGHPMAQSFTEQLAYGDSLRTATSARDASAYALVIARSYEALGLVESAIDYALEAARLAPDPAAAYRYLARLYQAKGRALPAYRALVHAGAPGSDPELAELRERLYITD